MIEEMKVSIITVTYNSAQTLAMTIESVLRQTYQDIEYIVKDGGSTDKTIDIIKKYEPMFHGRMKWMSAKDKGIYDGMNKGIEMATGNVVGILNSDDFFTDNHVIEKIADAFNEKKVDAIYGDVHFVKGSNLKKSIRYYSSRLFCPFWLRFGFMPAHPSFYVRRDVFSKVGLYKTDYKIGADFEMMVRMFYRHRITYHYLPYDFVTMRTGGVSTRDINSRRILLKEDVRACRENGIRTNQFLIALKYLYKFLEYRF